MELGTCCFWIFLSLYRLELSYTVSLHTACLLRVPPATQSVCFTKLELSSIILAGLFERKTPLEIDLCFHSLTSICSLHLSLFLPLVMILKFHSLLNGVLKSLPRHKLFTTAQPTKARKQSNIRAGNGQLLPRSEWSDLSRSILKFFQWGPFDACLKCSNAVKSLKRTYRPYNMKKNGSSVVLCLSESSVLFGHYICEIIRP